MTICRPWIRLLTILMALAHIQQAFAAENQPGSVTSTAGAPWQNNLGRNNLSQNNEEARPGPRVRIGLRLTTFSKVVTRTRDQKTETRFVPLEPLRHTLRARLNKINHFFVGDYHVESRPLKWVAKTKHFEVRLSFYKRFGAYGQLEESVGHVDVSGVLEEQEPQVHVLVGVGRKRMRDKFGNPMMDVVAGFTPSTKPRPVLSKKDTVRRLPRPAMEAPADYDGALIRGRF